MPIGGLILDHSDADGDQAGKNPILSTLVKRKQKVNAGRRRRRPVDDRWRCLDVARGAIAVSVTGSVMAAIMMPMPIPAAVMIVVMVPVGQGRPYRRYP